MKQISATLAILASLLAMTTVRAQSSINISMDELENAVVAGGVSRNAIISKMIGETVAISDAIIVQTHFDGGTFGVLAKNHDSGSSFGNLMGFSVGCSQKTTESAKSAAAETFDNGQRYDIVGQWSQFDDRGMLQVLSLDNCKFTRSALQDTRSEPLQEAQPEPPQEAQPEPPQEVQPEPLQSVQPEPLNEQRIKIRAFMQIVDWCSRFSRDFPADVFLEFKEEAVRVYRETVPNWAEGISSEDVGAAIQIASDLYEPGDDAGKCRRLLGEGQIRFNLFPGQGE